MKKKSLLMVFSVAFLIALLAFSSSSTNAALTNNWGAEEGTTITYTIEETYESHKASTEFEITITNIADSDDPSDDLADLFFTYEIRVKGTEEMEAGEYKVSGDEMFDHMDIIFPLTFDADDIPILPVLPISDDALGHGLDWGEAESDIEDLDVVGWADETTVTVSDGMFKAVVKDSGVDSEWGRWSDTVNVEWDKSTGVLQSLSWELESSDAGITMKVDVTQGELGEGFLEENINFIALGALGFGFLALLVAIVK